MIFKLPGFFKRNLTFKRGNNINKRLVGHLGPHGHKASNRNSSSASPEEPRAFVWDEASGFTASWNSGNPAHRAHDRLDLYGFDFENKKHVLTSWFPADKEKIFGANEQPNGGESCTTCHGQVQRPIFPMYPDWPQFYGEFNDEMSSYPKGKLALRSDLRTMANEFQPVEKKMYFDFLKNEAKNNLRYKYLFDVKPRSSANNPYYPFRPNTAAIGDFSNVSRAFENRPNLRLGVLYNRLTALQVFEKIKEAPLFQKFPDTMFYALLDCNWDFVDGFGENGRRDFFDRLLVEAHKIQGLEDLNLRGVKFKDKSGKVSYRNKSYTDKNYRQIPYEDLLRMLDLKIEDIDIRFKHNSSLKVARGYNIYDSRAFYHTDNAMDIGYLEDKYKMNPVCNNSGRACNFSYRGTYMEGMKYFNSYFDGSATMNELLAAQMLLYLTSSEEDFSDKPELNDVRRRLRAKVPNPNIYFETFNGKYSNFTARLELDQLFFDRMDSMSPWIQLPYPPDMLNIQNRESFWGNRSKVSTMRNRHAMWTSLSNRNSKTKNDHGNNICWNVYYTMEDRYRK